MLIKKCYRVLTFFSFQLPKCNESVHFVCQDHDLSRKLVVNIRLLRHINIKKVQMKKYILVVAILLTIQFTNAQSKTDEDRNTSVISLHDPSVVKTLQKYMEGSSYNKKEMLLSAFADNAVLYLTNREGAFKRYTPREYADFFKNAEKGKFNGREAKILDVKVTKEIATAKVEIAGPNREWVYIDLFLLKKFKNNWKIISKTAARVDDIN